MRKIDKRGRVPRKPAKKKVTLEFLLTFYEAFLREYEVTKIAASLNTTVGTLYKWIDKFPELYEAKQIAEQRRKSASTFTGYVYKHLSEEAKAVWDKIQFWESCEDASSKVDAMLSGRPTKLRQEIFVHALIHYGFNLSEACRIACVSRQTVETWRKADYSFLQLLEEIEWHKRNFFEHALVDLVACRNPGAVMFVNRTKNADRGYGEKSEVQHTGRVDIGIAIDELDLSMQTRLELLKALRAKQILDVREVRQLEQHTTEKEEQSAATKDTDT